MYLRCRLQKRGYKLGRDFFLNLFLGPAEGHRSDTTNTRQIPSQLALPVPFGGWSPRSVPPAKQSGTCWVAVNKDGTFAYVADTVSSVTSIYAINPSVGSVTLVTSFASFSHATDLAFSVSGRFLVRAGCGSNPSGDPLPGKSILITEPSRRCRE